MKYTDAQLQQLWVQNGGSPSAAPMAASIALAESGGDPNATNHNTNGSIDRGLWQINSVHGAQSTYDISQNVKSAINISNNGHSWSPWSTFNNGAFRQFLSGSAGATVAPTAVTPSVSTGGGILGVSDSSFKYAGIWLGALVLAVYMLWTGLDRGTHGTLSRTRDRVGKTAGKTAMVAA